jgi:hypothetical protein
MTLNRTCDEFKKFYALLERTLHLLSNKHIESQTKPKLSQFLRNLCRIFKALLQNYCKKHGAKILL